MRLGLEEGRQLGLQQGYEIGRCRRSWLILAGMVDERGKQGTEEGRQLVGKARCVGTVRCQRRAARLYS
jgi:hypothetical protein